MLKLFKILVMAHALVGGAAMLSACGQTGPLYLPDTAASANRATLTQTLNPWRTPPVKGQNADPATKPQATPPQATPPQPTHKTPPAMPQ